MKPELIKNRKEITKTVQQMKQISTAIQTVKLFDRQGGVFKISDYDLSKSKPFQKILDLTKKGGGDVEDVTNIIKGMRASVDNLSYSLLNRSLPEDVSKIINEQIGSYLTTDYKLYLSSGLFSKYKPTSQQLKKAIESRYQQLLKSPENKNRTTQFLREKATRDVNKFVKSKSLDEIPVTKIGTQNADVDAVVSPVTKKEVEAVQINPSILKPKQLEEWQRIVAGEIKDPRYTFYSTVLKQSQLNSNTKFLNNIYDILSKGDNKRIYTKDEMLSSPVLRQEIDVTTGQPKNPNRFKRVESGSEDIKALSPLEGLYIRTPTYDAIFDVSENILKNDLLGNAYRYAILAPKGISQISKTILSALTHARNFISAGAFAAANGIIYPEYGSTLFSKSGLIEEGMDKSLIGVAKDLTYKRVVGRIPKETQQLYERLLRAQVVGTQVQSGEMRQLIGETLGNPDVAAKKVFGNMLDKNRFRKLINKSSEVYGKIEDAYVAEDDFWKILTWGVERNRYQNVFNKYGITEENFNKILRGDRETLASLVDESGKNIGADVQKFLNNSIKRNYDPSVKQYLGTYEQLLDEVAGDIVRNNVPNYAYIGRAGRALRLSPFGNFIAFPLEIIRTGNNILEQSIKEMQSNIPEIASIGRKRFFGFGATTVGVPAGLTAFFKSKNDVTNEEMDALRQFVPPWSKNSTLLPVGRDENGYLKYVDFSYSNAYDTLIRPFNAVLNEMAKGDSSEQSLMSALGNGMLEATNDLLDPFVSESIFTEAFFDSTIRRGRGLQGKQIWSPADDTFTKIYKGVGHIAEVFTPGSIAQFQRLSDAVTGKTDTYGRTFDFEDEIKGLWGFRALKVDPERGLIYKTTQFSKNLKEAENLFTRDLLRGGRVSPEKILNSYKYSEQRRFETLKEMYRDIEAAKQLGMSTGKIKARVKRRGVSKDVFNDLMKGKYTPKQPSNFFKKRISQINRDLNSLEGKDEVNPYLEARPFINEIISQNRNLNLKTDELNIPSFKEPEVIQEIQTPMQSAPLNTPMPAAPQPTTQLPSTQAQTYASLFPRDELGNLIAQRKIT